ncbi:MAG TPA: hypothetical protein VGX70_00185, partial [Gemmataceae bacterium]|nr:hypothetical protein [Gemmataceae bacterium]
MFFTRWLKWTRFEFSRSRRRGQRQLCRTVARPFWPVLEMLEDRFLPSFLVTNTNDSGPGSLRQAILDTNADTNPVSHINFNLPTQDLFVSNYYQSTVDEFTTSGTLVRHFIPAGSGGLNGPNLLRFGPDGNLYVDSTGTNSIKKYDGQTGAYLGDVFTNPGGPEGFVFDPSGNLYVAEYGTGVNRVDKVNPSTGLILQSYSSLLTHPYGLAFRANGDLLVGNVYGGGSAQTITEINPVTGVASTFATGFGEPAGLTAGSDGRFYAASDSFGDSGPHDIVQVVGANGGVAQQFNVGGSMSGPVDLVFHSNGNLFVVSYYDSKVSEFDGQTGAFIASFQPYGGVVGAGGITVGPVVSGTRTIAPLSALPTITHPVIIDGTTQPGYAGKPIIELSGASAGAGVTGLTITAGNSTVDGLVINRFSGDGIDLLTNGGDLVEGNYIGTDMSGTMALGNSSQGILIQNRASNNTIGGTASGSRNIISGNLTDGIHITDSGTTGNLIEGNYIGTNASGTAAIPNVFAGVVIIGGASGNTVGGPAGNIISGNGSTGILLYGTGTVNNTVAGNYIGTNAAGTGALGNLYYGILMQNGGSSNTIGGTTSAARNVISGNSWAGVGIADAGTTGNIVEGNFIGTDTFGTAAIPNDRGVWIWGAPGNTIGGTVAAARNIISANSNNGVEIYLSGATNNVVEGNYIGTDVTGTVKLPNAKSGVLIYSGASGNTIGGSSAVDPSTGRLSGAGNLLSGNLNSGVQIAQATGNVVQGNFIGTDATGEIALGNDPTGVLDGIDILDGSNNTIGGVSLVDTHGNLSGLGNLISGNMGTSPGFGSDGVYITDQTPSGVTGSPSTNNVVQGNFIGTDLGGTVRLGNAGAGVYVSGVNNETIGGVGAGNSIAYNSGDGVLEANASSISIRGNSIHDNGGLGINLGPYGGNNQQSYPVLTG